MVARLVRDPFDREGCLFELRWDGFRTIAETDGTDGVKLYSRNQTSRNDSHRLRTRWPRANAGPMPSLPSRVCSLLSTPLKHQAPQKSRATESLTLPITGARRFQIARECRLVIKGPREHRMKLDGFGKIPFLHRRVDGPLNTMIP